MSKECSKWWKQLCRIDILVYDFIISYLTQNTFFYILYKMGIFIWQSIITTIRFLKKLFLFNLNIEIFSLHHFSLYLHLHFLFILLLDLFLYLYSFAYCYFEGKSNDQSVHFIELWMIWAINHTISKDFYSFFKIIKKCIINYSLVTKLKDYYNKKNNISRISSYELTLSPCSIFISLIK